MLKQDDVKKSFSPTLISWLIAVIVGIILPLFLQDFIANQISNLSTPLPTSVEETVTPNPALMFTASLFLFMIAVGYVFAIGYQILSLATVQKISLIWSFVLTILGPLFIWLILPYAFVALGTGN